LTGKKKSKNKIEQLFKFKQRRIAIVDHDRKWRELVRVALTQKGALVTVGGYRTYQIERHIRPELVILGCIAFEADEIRVVIQLLRCGIEVVVMPAEPLSQKMRELVEFGICDVVKKTNDMTEIFKLAGRKLREIDRQPPRPPNSGLRQVVIAQKKLKKVRYA